MLSVVIRSFCAWVRVHVAARMVLIHSELHNACHSLIGVRDGGGGASGGTVPPSPTKKLPM